MSDGVNVSVGTSVSLGVKVGVGTSAVSVMNAA